jgi:PST family polysaccharide transporter
MRSLSAMILLNVLVVVPLATLTRDFQYRTVGLMSLAATIVGALAALPLALGGSGVLALVVQRLAGVGFFAVAVTAVTRWVPKARVTPSEIVSALHFSLPLIGSNLVDYLSRTGFALVAGLRLDVVSLGYLRVAQRLVEVLQEVVVSSISRIFLPLFVSIRDEPVRRYDVMLRIMNIMALLVVGCFAVAGATARPLIDSMFGLHLQPAAPVFAVLSWLGPFIVVSAFVRPLLISCGRNGQMLLISSVNAVTMGIVAYLTVPFGLTILGEALVARSFLAILFMVPFIGLTLQHPVGPVLTTLILPIAAGIAAQLIVVAAETHLLPSHVPAIMSLIVEGSLAVATYGLILLVFARHRSMDMVMLMSRTLVRVGHH